MNKIFSITTWHTKRLASILVSSFCDSQGRLPNVSGFLFLVSGFLMVACEIEPELYLPDDRDVSQCPLIRVEMSALRDINAFPDSLWFYGWDINDSLSNGSLYYLEPYDYEVRRYYLGESAEASHEETITSYLKQPVYADRYRFGYHDLLVWTGLGYLPFGQSVIINEGDPDNVYAMTTSKNMSPEVFYRGYMKGIYVSRDTSLYDYFDEEKSLWVKTYHIQLVPAVYIYRVQVILYNNRDRIGGVTDACAVDGLSRYVNLTTSTTSLADAPMFFPMRMKNGITVRGKQTDIIGGKMTTFGLCGMHQWVPSAREYDSSIRTDLHNSLILNLHFTNKTDTTYYYKVTDQLARQPYGGLITVEIDVDTLHKPVNPNPPVTGSGFDPNVNDYDEEEREIIIGK